MGISNLSYEECRRKRVEENKKRMEALNLPLLSQALLDSSPSKSSSPSKLTKPRVTQKQLVVVRRSSRVAKQPTPVYAEVLVDRVVIPRRARDFPEQFYASDEARKNAFERALELHSGLEPNYPICIKSMVRSHVSGCFWLGLPAHFCKTHLPKNDGVMTLIDEDGDEYPIIYLARKTGFSGGWKGFSIAHKLSDGDAVVFQRIKPTACKVYIFRANGSKEDSDSNSS
ncbi:B3 domain-containing protein At5g42700-like [Benincasa hispida]|uniref:B3 domain-containing protein At5g42700-like n=1 Tax=Benincasa hispida TaxID=102211 RepID=UPI0019009926|nr:B3 domain-containing protein At5g42700-like [Benincasa hispida]XP_038885680.1 B3 domain-containing protein At5g42700-like [Benincasa hispida]